MQQIIYFSCLFFYQYHSTLLPKTNNMKKILFVFSIAFLVASCKKNDPIPETLTSTKIYFQGNGFVSGASYFKQEIYAVNEDGTNPQQLTNFSNNGTLEVFTGEPALTPDGQKIVFVSHKDILGGEIFSMNTNGTGLNKIISNTISNSSIQGPVVFPNGQKILYFQELGTGMNRHGEIFTADINGSNKLSLTSNFPTDGNCYDPCINPAGTTIVYSNLTAVNNMQLYAMDVSGTNKHLLTTAGPAIKKHPQFSPDGTKIVFDDGGYLNTNIHIMNADGSDIKKLTTNNNSWAPTFSKDGKSIYYTGEGRVYKMNTDGTNQLPIWAPFSVTAFNICVK